MDVPAKNRRRELSMQCRVRMIGQSNWLHLSIAQPVHGSGALMMFQCKYHTSAHADLRAATLHPTIAASATTTPASNDDRSRPAHAWLAADPRPCAGSMGLPDRRVGEQT